MNSDRSRELLERALKTIPGGVNSPVRAYGAVGGTPPFIEHGKGSRVFDVDGNEYIDYVGSWGPLIVGHANPAVLSAVRKTMERGTSFGAPTEIEIELAEEICKTVASIEKVRMVSSGTEATLSAIRLARGVTGRDRILKFDGCYHGHSDGLLVGAGSGVATLGIPGSPGVPKAMTELTVQAPFNDLDAVANAFKQWGDDLACVIVEPIAGNMGFVAPQPGFLEGLRALCSEHGAILIFDEVMTGFRVHPGCAQARYGVTPDITCLGKVVGGGLPAAAYGGRRDLMERIAPEGDVYQAGTLSGNPLAMAAGLETLRQLKGEGVYEQLAARSEQLTKGFEKLAAAEGVEFSTDFAGGMLGFFFHPGPVRSFADSKQASAARFVAFFTAMLEGGVYLAPSSFEAGFVSTTHTEADIRQTLAVAESAFQAAAKV